MLTAILALTTGLLTTTEEAPWGSGMPVRIQFEEPAGRAQAELDRRDLFYLGAAFRLTFPGGDVVSGIGGPKYSDLFSDGVGVGIQGDYLWRLTKSVLFGAYLEVDFDTFAGASTTDSFGTTLKLESMSTPRVLVGAKVREEFGREARFFSEQFMGFGANFYPSVKGTLSGASTGSGEFFGQKTSLAFDVGVNLGWDVTAQLALVLGFELEVNGGPGKGRDLVIVSSGSSTPQTMVNGGITLGMNIRF